MSNLIQFMEDQTRLSPAGRLLSDARGMTLLEMMVAVAIVGILANVASTSYEVFKQKAIRVEAKLFLKEIKSGIEQMERETLDRVGHVAPSRNGCTANPEFRDLSACSLGLTCTDGTYQWWAGPYLTPEDLTDPWGRPYYLDNDFFMDGVVVRAIGSAGPNGRAEYGGDDEIMVLCYP